jgi:hypothetical protein
VLCSRQSEKRDDGSGTARCACDLFPLLYIAHVTHCPVAGTSMTSYFPPIGSFTRAMSLSGARTYPNSSSTLSAADVGILPGRRRLDRYARLRRQPGEDTVVDEPLLLPKKPAPEMDYVIKNVVGAIDKEAELRNVAEKKKQKAKTSPASESRPLVRTASARPLQAPKRRLETLSRRMSEELLGRTDVVPKSRAKERGHLEDMRWIPTPETNVLKAGHSTRGTVAASFRPISGAVNANGQEETPKVSKSAIPEAKTMPPPPPPALVHHHPPQPKRSPSPVLLDLVPTQPATQTTSRHPPVLGMRRVHGHGTSSPLHSSQHLPNKQRGFKIPFARSGAGGSQASSTSTCSMSLSRPSYEMSESCVASAPSPPSGFSKPSPKSRTPSPTLEADSSYGEISFDMDIVEETMKQYDEI